MNRNIKSVGVLVSLLLLLLVGIAQATPDVPNLLYGDVTINCADAPTGTVIEAYIDGTLRGTITTDIVGEYGTSGIKLSVLGDSATEEDAVISFTINGITAVETILWQPMADVRELGLSTICATPGVAIISIDDASADSGLTSTTPIRISDLSETVGAIEIVLTYDADVEVVSVTPGSMGTITPGINNGVHSTTIAWSDAVGFTGDQILANVEIRALGDSGEDSNLELTVNTFVSTGLANIPNQVDNGIFTINPEDTCTCDFCFDLEEGWNMVSIPKTIDTLQQSNIANDLFDLANDEVCLYYNASPDCPDMDRWEQNPEIVPCQGYFVFKNDPYQVCAHFLVEGTGSPPTQEIFVGWNLIGHVDIVPRPVEQFLFATGLDDVRQLWHRSVDGSWEGYPWDGLTEVTQAHGYWAYSNSDDEMAGTLYCP